MADPLAQYRKTPPSPPGSATPKEASGEYVAFMGRDKVSRLRIRRAMAPTRSPGYAYLLDIVYDGSFGTNFVLVYTFLMVLVRGRNLQALISGLENGMVDYIQEYDPDIWPKPADEKAAFIESIEVVVQESGSSTADSEKPNDVRH